MCDKSTITDKEILDLAWKYFQQHAQQRISYFNFFVVFSVLMTTGLLTTFQEKYAVHFIGIAIGLMLSLISFVFWKIDERNKFLTKHGENAIKEIEKKYQFDVLYDDANKLQIFCTEENATCQLKTSEQAMTLFRRQISHSQSFNIIFLVFFLTGVLGAISSAYYQFDQRSQQEILNKQKSEGDLQLGQKLDDTNKKLEELRLLCTDNNSALLKVRNQTLKMDGAKIHRAP